MSPRLTRFKNRSPVQGAATEIILAFGGVASTGGGSRVTKCEIVRCKLKRISGTAANFTPLMNSDTGKASGTIEQVLLGAATAVGVLFDPVIAGAFTYTDVLGNLYLLIQPDAGADNIFDYDIQVKVWL